MTQVLTRDPAAYRRKRQERRALAIEKTTQTTKCYVEHLPPQIMFARQMMTCMNRTAVLPKFVGRGVTCLTIYEPKLV